MKENDFMTLYKKITSALPVYMKDNPGFRYGQAVFNYIDEKYGVARDVQFIDNIDCFYDDSEAQKFITASVLRIMNNYNNKF